MKESLNGSLLPLKALFKVQTVFPSTFYVFTKQ